VRPGISIGHYLITAGTLGCLAIDNKDDKVVILSNNHVLANCNDAKVGDLILQPGPYDIRRNYPDKPIDDFNIGHLKRFVEIKWSTTCPFRKVYFKILGKIDWENKVDCAIASLYVDAIPELFSTDKAPCGVNADSHVGDKVFKDGRTTCFTDGRIIDLHWSGYVNYGDKRAYFVDQIAISRDQGPFSQGGDSGSLIIDEDYRAVGLLFAGSTTVTVANKIKNVLEALDIRIPERW